MERPQARNMTELYPRLKRDIESYIDLDRYRKVWLQYSLQNKKKQMYGFIITLFPHGNSGYEQRFLYRVFVNFAKHKNENGDKVYHVENYEEVLNKIRAEL